MAPGTPPSTEHHPALEQTSHRVRFAWGAHAAEVVKADVAVVVDVLSFTTSLTVAVERGIEVFPFQWRDTRATEHALRHGASLAVGRFEALAKTDARHVSIAPSSLNEAEGIERLVLPNEAGAAIAFSLLDGGAKVLAGCLRNADAVADHVVRIADALGRKRSVVVVAAGERWTDGSLRPGMEDLWGAGAILDGLLERGMDDFSVEARTALAAYLGVEEELREALHDCASGREMIEDGHAIDVDLASQINVTRVVPVLRGESFVSAPD